MRQLLKKLLAPVMREVIKKEISNEINGNNDFRNGRWWTKEEYKPTHFHPQDADSDKSFGLTRGV